VRRIRAESFNSHNAAEAAARNQTDCGCLRSNKTRRPIGSQAPACFGLRRALVFALRGPQPWSARRRRQSVFRSRRPGTESASLSPVGRRETGSACWLAPKARLGSAGVACSRKSFPKTNRFQCCLTPRSSRFATAAAKRPAAGARHIVCARPLAVCLRSRLSSNVRLHKNSPASAAAKRGHGPRNPEQVRCLHWRQPQGSRRGGSCRNA
jgi:hypothetical protein